MQHDNVEVDTKLKLEMKQLAEQAKHNFSIIIVAYIRLGRLANVQHLQEQAQVQSEAAAASK